MAKFLSSEFTGPEESPGFLLWQVCMSWQRKQRQALAVLDLTHVQFVLLASICWLQKKHPQLTQAQLASHVKTDPMMTSQVLRTLELCFCPAERARNVGWKNSCKLKD